MADGYYKAVKSSPAVVPNLSLTDINLAKYNRQVNQSTIKQKEQVDACVDLGEYMDIEITYEPHEELEWWQEGLNWIGQGLAGASEALMSAGATLVVGATSVLSGALDVVEGIGDGAVWLVAGGADLLGFDDAAHSMREYIAEDQVGNLNKWFYEETSVGQVVNKASYMKYDSDFAQGIRTVTETGVTFVAATAATVLTGGAASVALPLTLGFLSGSGKKAETVYQKNEGSTTGGQEAQIFLSGVGGAASWYFQGKAGEKAIDAIRSGAFQSSIVKAKTASQTAIQNTKTNLQTTYNAIKSSFQNNGFIETMKNGGKAIWNVAKSGAKRIATNVKANFPETIKESITDLSSNIDFVTDKAGEFFGGERDFTLDAVGAVAAEWAFDRVGDMLESNRTNVIDDFADDIEDGLTSQATHQLRDQLRSDTELVSKVESATIDYIDSLTSEEQIEELSEESTMI